MSLCKAQKDNTPVYHDSKPSVLLTFIQLKECFSNAIFNHGMNTKRLSFSHSYPSLRTVILQEKKSNVLNDLDRVLVKCLRRYLRYFISKKSSDKIINKA